MVSKEVEMCIKVAACICAKDGVISQSEEDALYKCVVEKHPLLKEEEFDSVMSEFINSTNQLEHYLSLVEDVDVRKFALYVAKTSASADGLDIAENLAYKKACAICGVTAE